MNAGTQPTMKEHSKPTDRGYVQTIHGLANDVMRPNRLRFWCDLITASLVGWTSLLLAAGREGPLWSTALLVAVAIVAQWRSVQFLHEVVHLKRGAVPGFSLAWNLLVGIPFLLPTFLFGSHLEHHQRRVYGTADDPEYVRLSAQTPWHLLGFLFESLLAPLALLIRFALIAPLSALSSALRRIVVAKLSSLALNRRYVRKAPEGRGRWIWLAQECACTAWAWTIVVCIAQGVVSLRTMVVVLISAQGVSFLNQLKTMVAHAFDNDGTELPLERQILDSVTVPGHPLLTEIWAPLGNRYHALHHCLPSLPYHSIGTVHARCMAALPEDAVYRKTVALSLRDAMGRLLERQQSHRTDRLSAMESANSHV
jgi:fatty acid desaturase